MTNPTGRAATILGRMLYDFLHASGAWPSEDTLTFGETATVMLRILEKEGLITIVDFTGNAEHTVNTDGGEDA